MRLSASLIKKSLTTSIVSSLLLCNAAMAASHSEHTQHDAHEHGVARLTIATTDDGLEIGLESPAANLFGFEHLASTGEDHHTIHSAVETLKKGNEIFYATAAAVCTQSSVEVESAQVKAHDHEKHGDEDHDHGKHEEHADHDDHESGSTHNDVDVTWNFKCEKPSEIKRVDIRLFSTFPKGFETISVDWISADKAGNVDLSADGMVLLSQ
ncbi:DUF2796 domain-containing protein [Leucothrix pacifica]|uniref:DUF2796 domain-containing protein n=1 Tax=Leucothrix pacifica TaxID=1247513 RepID=A0A317C208_9GAMM|nr:DUF2796 domain-containing protein [Leucothrix pacifica]PWQ92654.1 DUF2796 domain-containing protein [Leucothrix pacifica]